jgi:hypothetical protein
MPPLLSLKPASATRWAPAASPNWSALLACLDADRFPPRPASRKRSRNCPVSDGRPQQCPHHRALLNLIGFGGGLASLIAERRHDFPGRSQPAFRPGNCRRRARRPRQTPAPRRHRSPNWHWSAPGLPAGRAPPPAHRPALAIDQRPAPGNPDPARRSLHGSASPCPTTFSPPSRPSPPHRSSRSCPACSRPPMPARQRGRGELVAAADPGRNWLAEAVTPRCSAPRSTAGPTPPAATGSP